MHSCYSSIVITASFVFKIVAILKLIIKNSLARHLLIVTFCAPEKALTRDECCAAFHRCAHGFQVLYCDSKAFICVLKFYCLHKNQLGNRSGVKCFLPRAILLSIIAFFETPAARILMRKTYLQAALRIFRRYRVIRSRSSGGLASNKLYRSSETTSDRS